MRIVDVEGNETEQEAQLRQLGKKDPQVVPTEDAPPPDWDDEFQAEVTKRNAATAAARAPIGAVGGSADPRTVSLPSGEAQAAPAAQLDVNAPIVPESPVFAGKMAALRSAGMPGLSRFVGQLIETATESASPKKKSEKLQELEASAVLEVVQLKDVTASTQPRKHFDEENLKELAESIKGQGLIQPPLLLRVDDKYVVVVGERRVRASRLAGLKVISALVRTNLSAEEILDAQVAENVLREDLTALEEAGAYGRMVDPAEKGGLGRSVDTVAAKLGKSRVWVYGRLKLLDLCAEGQKELQRGGLSASVAEAVARINSHDQQRKCLADLDAMRPWRMATEREDRDPVSVRSALDLIREKYMLDLSRAPFDKKDDLLTAAGACAPCPFNSTNQPGDLFSTKSKGHCLRADCYKEKCEASWVKEKERAEKRGHKVLSLAKGRELYRGGALKYDGPYVELHGPCVDDEKRRTYKALLGIHCPQVTVCPDDTGKPREIVDRAAAIEGLAAAGHKFAREVQKAQAQAADAGDPPTRGASAKEKNRQFEREQKVRELVTVELIEATVKRVEAKGLSAGDLLAIADEVVLGGNWDVLVERRGIKGGYQGLTNALPKATERELQGMIMEALITSRGAGQDTTGALAKLAGLKMDELEKKVRAALATADDIDAALKAKSAEKNAADKKSTSKKKKGGSK